MKTIRSEITNKQYKFYNSAKEIPVKRWNDFLSKLAITSQLGSDFNDCANRLSEVDEYLKRGDKEGYTNARTALQYELFFIYKGINNPTIAIAELLHSIDDVQFEHTMEDKHKVLLDDDVFTVGLVEELLEDLRKK